jgi:uncharacterized membrane protein YbhN (UPF0104 family)
VLIAVLVPRAAGTTWSAIEGTLGGLSAADIAVLTLVWALGLWVHSFVLTASLPGLSRRRALTLNLTGSAVANVVPLGGAFGVALNWAMVRSWRFRPLAFTRFTLVSNVWDVLAKLLLPVVALLALLAGGSVATHSLRVAAALAVALLMTGVSAIVAMMASDRAARALGAAADDGLCAVRRAIRRPASSGHDLEEKATHLRATTIDLVRAHWPQLSLGIVGYYLLQGLLLWLALTAVGSDPRVLGPAEVAAGFAVERMLCLVLVTPGGVGVSETGCVALLVALGGDPTISAAGVLLYRVFTYLLEIPVGGLGIAWWVGSRRLAGHATQPATGWTA